MNFIYVGMGGAVGAMLRYAISMLPNNSSFPVWTLVTNFLGAVFIGFITQSASDRNLPASMTLFLKTGVCGGFTTFSAFSLEAYSLFQDGMAAMGSIYAVCSVVLCILGIALGMSCAKAIVK